MMFWLKIPGFVDKKMVAECPDALKKLNHHLIVVLNSGLIPEQLNTPWGKINVLSAVSCCLLYDIKHKSRKRFAVRQWGLLTSLHSFVGDITSMFFDTVHGFTPFIASSLHFSFTHKTRETGVSQHKFSILLSMFPPFLHDCINSNLSRRQPTAAVFSVIGKWARDRNNGVPF